MPVLRTEDVTPAEWLALILEEIMLYVPILDQVASMRLVNKSMVTRQWDEGFVSFDTHVTQAPRRFNSCWQHEKVTYGHGLAGSDLAAQLTGLEFWV